MMGREMCGLAYRTQRKRGVGEVTKLLSGEKAGRGSVSARLPILGREGICRLQAGVMSCRRRVNANARSVPN